MMRATYPNLELLDYIAKQLLMKDEDYVREMESKKKDGYIFSIVPDLDATVFPQIWGSTCTGFDVCEDGTPAMGGSAMTKEYTVIFHELKTDIYIVFFGNRACYKVTDANEAFLYDMKEQNMASLSEAQKKY